MKLFLHWDMEGVSGLHARGQAWYWEEGVSPATEQEGRQLLTDDVVNSVQTALAAGVDELIVCDTHRGGGNLLVDQLPRDPRVTWLLRSRGEEDGRLRWLPGLNQTVDGFLVPGHHAKAGTRDGFLPHTWTGAWADFRINGQSVGEAAIEACFAGHWDVPVAFFQGDEAACREAQAMFPGIVTAAVKTAVSPNACTGPEPAAARALTAERLAAAIENLRAGGAQPFLPTLPLTVQVQFKAAEDAAKAAARPGVERLDDVTVGAEVRRRCDVVKWLLDTGLD